MVRFDKERVLTLINHINTALERLSALGSLEKEDFLSDPDKIASAKYHLITSIEAVIDICSHIISKSGFKTPGTYAEAFDILKEHSLIDQDLAKNLKNMVRFRNRLVHIYWDVDDELVYGILKSDIYDLEKFVDLIIKSLKEYSKHD